MYRRAWLGLRNLSFVEGSLVGPKRALYGLIELGIGLRDLGRASENLVGPERAW